MWITRLRISLSIRSRKTCNDAASILKNFDGYSNKINLGLRLGADDGVRGMQTGTRHATQ